MFFRDFDEDEPYLCEHGEHPADCGECQLEASLDEADTDLVPIEAYSEAA